MNETYSTAILTNEAVSNIKNELAKVRSSF